MRTLAAVAAVVALAACGSDKQADPAPGKAAGSAKLGSAAGSGSAGSGSARPRHAARTDDEEATAVEPEQPKKPALPEMKATVDLTLSGAVATTIKGVGGRCVCHDDTATFEIRSDDVKAQVPFDLTILVTTPAEWTSPAIMLNIAAPKRGSYARGRTHPDKLSIMRNCAVVKLDDVLLRGMAGSKGEITVKGSITCAK